MQPFDLVEPTSVPEAIAALQAGGPDVRLVAGGIALLIMMKQRLYAPRSLISLRRIPELDAISPRADGSLWIGATATHGAVQRHPQAIARYPLLAAAAARTANVRIRNVGTIGGNLVHADAQSDPPAALVALGATAHLQGPGGVRQVPLAEFLLGSYTTDLREGEMLVGVQLPPPPPGVRMAYLKFAPGTAGDRPVVNVAAVLQAEGGSCHDLRLVVGAVSGRPERLQQAEAALCGHDLTDANIRRAAEAAGDSVDPVDDLRGSAWYKRHMTRVLVRRVLLQLTEGIPA